MSVDRRLAGHRRLRSQTAADSHMLFEIEQERKAKQDAAAKSSTMPQVIILEAALADTSQKLAFSLVNEFFTTEESYVEGLKTLLFTAKMIRASMDLAHPLLSEADFQRCFALDSVNRIFQLHQAFLRSFAELYYREHHLSTLFVELLSSYLVKFQVAYAHYMQCYSDMILTLQELRLRSPDLDWLLRLVERSAVGISGIDGLFIQPIQRLPRVVLLLESMSSRVCKDSAEAAVLAEKLVGVTNLAKHVVSSLNLVIDANERRAQVLAVEKTLEKINGKAVRLATDTRLFLHSGALIQLFNKANRHIAIGSKYLFHVFNDLLLCTTVPSATSPQTCRVKYALPLDDELIIVDIPDYAHVSSTNTSSMGKRSSPGGDNAQSYSEARWQHPPRRGSTGSVGSSTPSESSVHLPSSPSAPPKHKSKTYRHIIGVYGFSKQVELQCASLAEKEQWLTLLTRALQENLAANETNKLHP